MKPVMMIPVEEFDDLVQETYGRTYSFQQQDGCKNRGTEHFTVPVQHPVDYNRGTVPENVNDPVMGVSFSAWLSRDPTQLLNNADDDDEFHLEMWWERNFYPSVDMILNDLHARGVLAAGDYCIDIDW